MTYAQSELILTGTGEVYHLKLAPGDIAGTLLLVGDPGRVETVSSHFDSIELKKQNREFCTHTGHYKGKRISVLSTGIGTDNIDIVINELDALVNIDLETRADKTGHTSLKIIRIGTSGAVHPDIRAGDTVAAAYSLGLDGLLNFYETHASLLEPHAAMLFQETVGYNKNWPTPYVVKAHPALFDKIAKNFRHGITLSAPGFYGPQGRQLRIKLADPDFNQKIRQFQYKGYPITNYEMESSALYGLSAQLGHQALTVCKIIADRTNKAYAGDYHKMMNELITHVLEGTLKLD